MDDQMFFFGPSLLDGRLLFPDIMSKIDPAQPVLTIPKLIKVFIRALTCLTRRS